VIKRNKEWNDMVRNSMKRTCELMCLLFME